MSKSKRQKREEEKAARIARAAKQKGYKEKQANKKAEKEAKEWSSDLKNYASSNPSSIANRLLVKSGEDYIKEMKKKADKMISKRIYQQERKMAAQGQEEAANYLNQLNKTFDYLNEPQKKKEKVNPEPVKIPTSVDEAVEDISKKTATPEETFDNVSPTSDFIDAPKAEDEDTYDDFMGGVDDYYRLISHFSTASMVAHIDYLKMLRMTGKYDTSGTIEVVTSHFPLILQNIIDVVNEFGYAYLHNILKQHYDTLKEAQDKAEYYREDTAEEGCFTLEFYIR